MSKFSLSEVHRSMIRYITQGFEPYALVKLLRVHGQAIDIILKKRTISKKSPYLNDILKIQDFFIQARSDHF